MSNVWICAECTHGGMRAWFADVGEHDLRARKKVSSAVERVTATGLRATGSVSSKSNNGNVHSAIL